MDCKIFYPTPLDEIIDRQNDNIDVCITVGRRHYTLVFITPDNLKSLMNSANEDFISPSFKYIVVKSLEEEYIEKAVENIVKAPELLKFYGA